MSCNCVALFAMYLLFLPPPSLPIDTKTADDTTEYDYVVDDQTLQLSFQASKTPLIIQISPILSLLCLH